MVEPKIIALETKEVEILEQEEMSSVDNSFMCPECSSDSIIIVSHCKTCVSCGWSMCSL